MHLDVQATSPPGPPGGGSVSRCLFRHGLRGGRRSHLQASRQAAEEDCSGVRLTTAEGVSLVVVLAADWAVAATAKMPAVMMEVKRIVKVVGGGGVIR